MELPEATFRKALTSRQLLRHTGLTGPQGSAQINHLRPSNAPKRDAPERWARRLQAIVEGKTRKVIAIAR